MTTMMEAEWARTSISDEDRTVMVKEKKSQFNGCITGSETTIYGRAIHARRLRLAIALIAAALLTLSPASGAEVFTDKIMLLYPFHAFLVSSGLLLLSAGMICARYMKRRRWWLKAHKTLGLAGAGLTLFGIMVAVYMVSASSGLNSPAGPHAYIGILVSLMVLFTPFMGFIQLKKGDKRLRAIHKWSGRMTIVLMIINAYLGWMIVQSF